MSTVNLQVLDKFFEPFISQKEIKKRAAELAAIIEDYEGFEQPVVVCVLDGSFRFVNDLMESFLGDYEICFVKVKSYEGMESNGNPKTLIDLPTEVVKNRNILIVEDIVDTGTTLKFLIKMLNEIGVKSVKTASLLFKPACYKADYKVDFIGFEIEPIFVVGYGMDYNGLGRGANHIYKLKE